VRLSAIKVIPSEIVADNVCSYVHVTDNKTNVDQNYVSSYY